MQLGRQWVSIGVSALVVAAATACSADSSVSTQDVEVASVGEVNESRSGPADLDVGQTKKDATEIEGVADADVSPRCESFGNFCQARDDCCTGFCVEHMGGKVCSQDCVEECPAGFMCEQVGAGADQVWICISHFERLCRPCEESADCTGDLAGVCITYDVDGVPGVDAALRRRWVRGPLRSLR